LCLQCTGYVLAPTGPAVAIAAVVDAAVAALQRSHPFVVHSPPSLSSPPSNLPLRQEFEPSNPGVAGDVWYLVDAEWWRQWVAFVGFVPPDGPAGGAGGRGPKEGPARTFAGTCVSVWGKGVRVFWGGAAGGRSFILAVAVAAGGVWWCRAHPHFRCLVLVVSLNVVLQRVLAVLGPQPVALRRLGRA
jgi:hypothetical protein